MHQTVTLGQALTGHTLLWLLVKPIVTSIILLWKQMTTSIVKASDGSDYGTLTPFGSGDPSFTSDYKGFTFVVPSDAPPLEIAYKNGYQGNTTFGNYKDLPITGSTYVVKRNRYHRPWS